jgi:hypothetical protein
VQLELLQHVSGGGRKNFCFFLEMQFLNDYKWYVIDIEVLRFSSIAFQHTGNKVSFAGTVSYPMKSYFLDCI